MKTQPNPTTGNTSINKSLIDEIQAHFAFCLGVIVFFALLIIGMNKEDFVYPIAGSIFLSITILID